MMRQLNPFFLIGTLGILFTAMFHVVVGAIFSPDATTSWSLLYPVFMGFLIIGTAVMIKKKKHLNNFK